MPLRRNLNAGSAAIYCAQVDGGALRVSLPCTLAYIDVRGCRARGAAIVVAASGARSRVVDGLQFRPAFSPKARSGTVV
jgi:hypothetical protein